MNTARDTSGRPDRPLRPLGDGGQHGAAPRRRGAEPSDLHGATLVLLRHGESKAHAAGILSGICDPALSREGREAARQACRLPRAWDRLSPRSATGMGPPDCQ
jgi:hypothetical protein